MWKEICPVSSLKLPTAVRVTKKLKSILSAAENPLERMPFHCFPGWLVAKRPWCCFSEGVPQPLKTVERDLNREPRLHPLVHGFRPHLLPSGPEVSAVRPQREKAEVLTGTLVPVC